MTKTRIWAVILLILGALGVWAIYGGEKGTTLKNYPFKYGLDLNGGTHLIYQADIASIPASDIKDSMQSLRDTIEKRVNVFGVSEPLVQVEEGNVNGQTIHKLIVELPGVTDIQSAIDTIGLTPTLEFRLLKKDAPTTGTTTDLNVLFESATITGKDLKRADIIFDPNTGRPQISLTFSDAGKDKFAEVTRNNVGRVLAILLDGQALSTPVIRDAITDGKAQITGTFSPDEAKKLVRDLNYGALPLPIKLVGSQTIGASLGTDALHASFKAGILSFIIISIFLILWYRIPGLIASFALVIYTVINLFIFKFIPVTLTSAGLAGFILSIGMAVDANILIFERMKEELKKGLSLSDAMKEGFARAWLSIRDSNLSSIITAFILYYFATSPLIKGFALVFAIGVISSMFTAITVSRTFLIALGFEKINKFTRFIFSSGIESGSIITSNSEKK